jgi:hypothetical protein
MIKFVIPIVNIFRICQFQIEHFKIDHFEMINVNDKSGFVDV